ncbi:MAG: tripartite tricarboxylate transporter substrate-binding protein [Acidovorax sp.]|uniref:tripartite tricarboxylate transporter substrate-binding protein n=1 Tax=Acidovorax sp. TaxID=1872122 RepID=UPI0039E48120
MNPPPISRRSLLGAASAAALWAAAPPAGAQQAVPESARIIVGFGAGGNIDILARLIAEQVGPLLGPRHHIRVENRPGGGGQIAAQQLLAAPADGSTYLIAPLITPVLSQLVYDKPGYDPKVDFTPVGLVAHFQFALAVPASHPARDARELIAWFKAHPDKANFGSPAAGSLPHFFGLLLGEAADVEIVHVAYKGGPALLADLGGGQLSSAVSTVSELLPLHRQGRIRIISTFGPQRATELPQVPTLAQQGYAQATGSGWFSLWARAGTPPAAVAAFNRALNTVLASPAAKAKLAELALEPDPRTPQYLEQLRVAEIEKWRSVIAASGFRAG